MAIVKRPTPKEQAAEAFIDKAPDGKSGRGIRRGKKEQIPVIMSPGLLDRLDEAAERMGMSRSAVITLAVNQLLKSGFGVI